MSISRLFRLNVAGVLHEDRPDGIGPLHIVADSEVGLGWPAPSMELEAAREILAEVFWSGCRKADERILFPWTASQDLGIGSPNSFI